MTESCPPIRRVSGIDASAETDELTRAREVNDIGASVELEGAIERFAGAPAVDGSIPGPERLTGPEAALLPAFTMWSATTLKSEPGPNPVPDDVTRCNP